MNSRTLPQRAQSPAYRLANSPPGNSTTELARSNLDSPQPQGRRSI
jgi:hypothetical protein